MIRTLSLGPYSVHIQQFHPYLTDTYIAGWLFERNRKIVLNHNPVVLTMVTVNTYFPYFSQTTCTVVLRIADWLGEPNCVRQTTFQEQSLWYGHPLKQEISLLQTNLQNLLFDCLHTVIWFIFVSKILNIRKYYYNQITVRKQRTVFLNLPFFVVPLGAPLTTGSSTTLSESFFREDLNAAVSVPE